MSKIDFVKQKIPFTQVANDVLNDPTISFKAKGVYAFLYSKADGWDFESKRIAAQSKDGRDSVRSALVELENAGYLKRHKLKNGRMVYMVIFPPMTGNPSKAQKPMPEKPNDGKPHSGKTRHISNKDSYKEIKTIQSNKDLAANAAENEIVSQEWNQLIDGFKPMNPLWEDIYKNTTERKALQHLADKIGKEKLLRTIQALPEIVIMKTAPRITKPTELKRDLGKLLVFYKQNQGSTNKFQVTKVHGL